MLSGSKGPAVLLNKPPAKTTTTTKSKKKLVFSKIVTRYFNVYIESSVGINPKSPNFEHLELVPKN